MIPDPWIETLDTDLQRSDQPLYVTPVSWYEVPSSSVPLTLSSYGKVWVIWPFLIEDYNGVTVFTSRYLSDYMTNSLLFIHIKPSFKPSQIISTSTRTGHRIGRIREDPISPLSECVHVFSYSRFWKCRCAEHDLLTFVCWFRSLFTFLFTRDNVSVLPNMCHHSRLFWVIYSSNFYMVCYRR